MSFYQNTSNQWATPEQSEPEANSSPATGWTEIFTNDQSEGHAASFGVQHESNRNNIQVSNNDGNLNLQEQDFVSSFSPLEITHANESNLNRLPSASENLHVLHSSEVANQARKLYLIELLDIAIAESKQESRRSFHLSHLQGSRKVYRVMTKNKILEYLAREFRKHDYCHVFKKKLMTFKFYIDVTIRNIRLDTPPIKRMHDFLNEISASIDKHVETLKTWDNRQCFLCGQSKRFANVVCAKDLLPQNDGPTICGICWSSIEETSDFAVQSDCRHIFCTPCISAWFETKENCPMCRQSGLFMSKDRLLEL